MLYLCIMKINNENHCVNVECASCGIIYCARCHSAYCPECGADYTSS